MDWCTDHYGPAAFIGRCRSVYQRTMGAVLAPMNAFLLPQGTVALHRSPRRERAKLLNLRDTAGRVMKPVGFPRTLLFRCRSI
jgi:O-acetylhomoserine/O-acetylserine sulfhydrylase-like pyridoxal-dependent enzyme